MPKLQFLFGLMALMTVLNCSPNRGIFGDEFYSSEGLVMLNGIEYKAMYASSLLMVQNFRNDVGEIVYDRDGKPEQAIYEHPSESGVAITRGDLGPMKEADESLAEKIAGLYCQETGLRPLPEKRAGYILYENYFFGDGWVIRGVC